MKTFQLRAALFCAAIAGAVPVFAQHPCQPIAEKIDRLIRAGQIGEANDLLDDLQHCNFDHNADISKKQIDLQKRVNEALTKSEKAAIAAKKKAEDEKKKAEDEQKKAQAARDLAEEAQVRNYNSANCAIVAKNNLTLATAWATKDSLDLDLGLLRAIDHPLYRTFSCTIEPKGNPSDLGWTGSDELLMAMPDGMLRRYDLKGTEVDSFRFAPVRGPDDLNCRAAISANGERMLTLDDQRDELTCWKLSKKDPFFKETVSKKVFLLAISITGKYWAVASPDSAWAFGKGGKLLYGKALPGQVSYLAISDKGLLVAACTDPNGGSLPLHFVSNDGSDWETPNEFLKSPGLAAPTFFYNADYLAVGSLFKTYLCKIDTSETTVNEAHRNTVYETSVGRGLFATASSDKTIMVWAAYENSLEPTAILKDGSMHSMLAVSQFSGLVASLNGEGLVRIWPTTGKLKTRFGMGSNVNAVTAMTFQKDSKSLLIGDDQGRITQKSLDGKTLKTWQMDPGDSIRCFFKMPKNRFAVGTHRGWVAVFDENSDEPVLRRQTDHGPVTAIYASLNILEDLDRLYSGHLSGNVCAWSNRLDPYGIMSQGSSNEVVSFSVIGEMVAVVRKDGSLQYFSRNTFKEPTYDPGFTDDLNGVIESACSSPDGRFLMASSNHVLTKWDLLNKYNTTEFKHGHANRVNNVAYSADSNFIVTTSWDKTAIVWDALGNKVFEVGGGQGQTSVVSLAVSPDGRYFATSTADVSIWRMPGAYAEEVVDRRSFSKKRFLDAGFLQKTKEYADIDDPKLLVRHAQIFQRENLTANSVELYKLAIARFTEQLKKLDPKSEDFAYEKEGILNNRFETHQMLWQAEGSAARPDEFIANCKDSTEMAFLARYFFTKKDWKNLKSACALWGKAIKAPDQEHNKLGFVAEAELGNQSPALSSLLRFPAGADSLDLMLDLMLFFDERAEFNIDYDRTKLNAVYSKAAFDIMDMKIYPDTAAWYPDFAIYNAINTYYFYLFAGRYAEMPPIAARTSALAKQFAGRGEVNRVDSILVALNANFLLFTGKYTEARREFERIAPMPDSYYRTYRAFFRETFKSIDSVDIAYKRTIIPKAHRAEFEQVWEWLKGEEPAFGKPIKGSAPSVKNISNPIPAVENMGEKPGAPALDTAFFQVKYRVVTGSFKKKENAEKQLRELTSSGHPGATVIQKDGFWLVVAGTFDDGSAARNFKRKLADQFAGMKPIVVQVKESTAKPPGKKI